jgi:periplasmic glucans biosynthesis protein
MQLEPHASELSDMVTTQLSRRSAIGAIAAWASLELVTGSPLGEGRAIAQTASADGGEAFPPDHVFKLAQALAGRPIQKPKFEVPEPFSKLTAEQYRDIRFRADQAIWRGEKLEAELQLFAVGWIYGAPVDIFVVDNGRARALKADGTLFAIGGQIPNAPHAAPYGFSGFRVHGPINRSDYFDEYAVFQGASFFRSLGRGQIYGLSARGLAINVGRPGGEEVPMFRAFWIEKPKPGVPEIVVHGLLDSPSVTGAYRFVIQPGISTLIDVDMTLFARREIQHIGFAPLTSMFLHGTASRRTGSDIRPSVHDSEGLAILNGKGERLWRPLTNPRKLQTSAFVDNDPKGFGLSQRDRSFSNFEDLDAHYERRPTVWVEPKGAWGEGAVELFEIPAEEEIHDNITVFWRPAKALEADKPYKLAYRLSWGDAVPVAWTGARVRKTRVGTGRKGAVAFVVDFDGPGIKDVKDSPVADIWASAGTVSNVLVQKHPEIGGVRCTFDLQAGSSELIELRLFLRANEQAVSENWLYRWIKA